MVPRTGLATPQVVSSKYGQTQRLHFMDGLGGVSFSSCVSMIAPIIRGRAAEQLWVVMGAFFGTNLGPSQLVLVLCLCIDCRNDSEPGFSQLSVFLRCMPPILHPYFVQVTG